jgi:nucleoside-diphosphate-sugar epimerase
LEVGVASSFRGRVLVTGAGGFIGSALCARLASAGIDHVAAVRTVAPQLAQRASYVALGDFAAADWGDALQGVTAVVHLAGLAHVPVEAGDSATPYIVANVHVTRRLAEAAGRSGVKRFVLASSVKVYGESSEPMRRAIAPCLASSIAAPRRNRSGTWNRRGRTRSAVASLATSSGVEIETSAIGSASSASVGAASAASMADTALPR